MCPGPSALNLPLLVRGSGKAEEQMLNACLLIKSFSIAKAGSAGTLGHAFQDIFFTARSRACGLSSYVLLTGRLSLQVAVIFCLPTGQAQPLSQRPVKYRLVALMKGSRWGNHRNSTPPKTATFFFFFFKSLFADQGFWFSSTPAISSGKAGI